LLSLLFCLFQNVFIRQRAVGALHFFHLVQCI
jgi:hypothetical protein